MRFRAAAASVALALLLGVLAGCGARPGPRGGIAPPVQALVSEAETAELRRDHDHARASYQRAVAAALDAGDAASEVFARRAFADTLLSWDELAPAKAQLLAITVRTPDDAPAWHDLGIVAYTLGDEATATGALARARALAPTDPRPRIALAAMKWRTGDRDGARTEYEGLLSLELPAKLREKVEWALRTLGPAPTP